jgi:hypothetical protein
MISRNFTKRLERLEGRSGPPRVIHLINVLYATGPDAAPVGGYTVGPGYGSQAPGAGSEGRASRGEWGICLNDQSSR